MKYTEDHEWLRVEGDLVVVGITEHAATQLGDVVFVELPEVEAMVAQGDEVVVIEDDGVRIEETRVGGAVRRVTVQSKVGNVRAYEIQVAPAGRDPSQERGNAGRRAWSLFSF